MTGDSTSSWASNEDDPEFIVFGAPAIEDAEIREVVATMKSGWLGTGPRVAQFERDFAAYKGAAYPVAVSSCTAALHLSMIAAGIGPGDEVITTASTFAATVNAIIHTGATPVLADIDRATMNIDPKSIRERLTSRSRAVVPVHFAGRACDMTEICDIVRLHGLTMIEDCAHAIETEYGGRSVGTFGDFGCFSFYVTKNVVTGEGGMILAGNEANQARVKVLALHGLTKDAWKRFGDEGFAHYQVVECGYKYNMTDLQASIGLHQLSRIESNWERRQKVWQSYDEAFRGLPIELPPPLVADTRHAYHLYTILVDEARTGISRDSFIEAMTRRGIGVGVHYMSIPEHPYYRDAFGWRPEDYPNAMDVGRRTVSLPLSAGLTVREVERVTDAVASILSSQ